MAAAKTSVYVIRTTCFDECSLFFVTVEEIIFHKGLLLLCDFFNRHTVAFSEASVLKEARVLCVISTITV